ncbi:uncharacterized protein [Misgurnus anguillicaudatus]|uniref:uncharacterized protein n=1 Tax=Misgurnus anguillicaudatus TaxID=75329 RepID=UPI003CCF551B
MLGIRREVRALLKGLRRGVVMHQIGVKQAKEGRVIPKAVLRQCLSEAKKRIPEVLDQLENDLQQKTQFSFYGYLTAYYASIYGHRLGFFQNLTIREVEGAVKSPSTGDYLINISLHKTNRAFGPAQLSLTAEEYGWFWRFLALRDRLVGGPDARLFFYTSTPNPCKNLNNYFQGAWVSMGLPGKPTFMDVRTSIATHARNTHSKADREKVSKFMCHDTSTADRFYAMNLNVKQAVEHRRLFEGALVGEEVSPAKPAAEEEGQGKRKRKTKHGRGAPKRRRDESPPSSPPTSSPEEESEAVPFQESGVSSLDSPPSLEKYPGEKEESPDSSSSSSVGASPVRTPSKLSAPSAEPASPAVHDPEQADPRQAEPEQAAPPLGLLSRPKRAAKRPVVVLTPVKPTLSPLSRNKICRVSGVRRALDKARK